MILQLLGLIDILAAANLGLIILSAPIKILTIILGSCLIVKGLIFLRSFASFIDLFAGILMIASIYFSIPQFLLLIAGFFILQKGVFSFL